MHFETFTAGWEDWNNLVKSAQNLHILQTSEWANLKTKYGWRSLRFVWHDRNDQIIAAALILKRNLIDRSPFSGFSVLYVPKGPLLWDWNNRELRERIYRDLFKIATDQKSIFVKIDPDIPIGYGVPGEKDSSLNPLGQQIVAELDKRGWCYSEEQIQFSNTVLIDLTPSEEELLARMKQKTRYNIRLALRKGVLIRIGVMDDLKTLYQMYAETSIRDNFAIRDKNYYLDLWSLFINAGKAEPIIAEVDGQVVAGLFLFHFGDKAWYLYGMSSLYHREKMPNYLLQWEAIKRAKKHGCRVYDLWGAPDKFTEQDPMWGVFRFKSGLGGQVVRHMGAYDLPLRPFIYKFYSRVVPVGLELLRKRGKASTEKIIMQ